MKENPYLDMIVLEHPTSQKHPRMPSFMRAAQFSPFSALVGYEEEIDEAGRLTEEKINLSEDERIDLDGKLKKLMYESPGKEACFTYFKEDGKKEGGQYITTQGIIKKLDGYENAIILSDGTKINLEDILEIGFMQK